jgi:hypothetical protein
VENHLANKEGLVSEWHWLGGRVAGCKGKIFQVVLIKTLYLHLLPSQNGGESLYIQHPKTKGAEPQIAWKLLGKRTP